MLINNRQKKINKQFTHLNRGQVTFDVKQTLKFKPKTL